MIFNTRVNGHSLAAEVRLAEKQLLLRKASLRQGVNALDAAVRRRMTAPDALLWGAGTGFILGELTKNRNTPSATSEHKSSQGESSAADDESARRPGTIQLALRYWAIARPIIATATNLLAPYLQARAAQEAEAHDAGQAMHQAGETHATHQHTA